MLQKIFSSNKTPSLSGVSLLGLSLFILVVTVQAATTISTDIQTDGTLSVTGTSTLAGNVGVGTTTPSYRLSVVGGDINLDQGRVFRYNGSMLAQASTTLNNFFFAGAGILL